MISIDRSMRGIQYGVEGRSRETICNRFQLKTKEWSIIDLLKTYRDNNT